MMKPSLVNGDHLRVCGADLGSSHSASAPAGSPPRVRSRLVVLLGKLRVRGITSACAEQTG